MTVQHRYAGIRGTDRGILVMHIEADTHIVCLGS